MAFVHGKGTAVSIDGDDLSAYSNSVGWTRSPDIHDVTTFGKNSKVKNGGLLDGSATLSGVYDNTASTGPAAVIEPLCGQTVVFVYRPEGAGTGRPVKTVDVVVGEYTETAPVADMVTWTVNLAMSDDVVITAGV